MRESPSPKYHFQITMLLKGSTDQSSNEVESPTHTVSIVKSGSMAQLRGAGAAAVLSQLMHKTPAVMEGFVEIVLALLPLVAALFIVPPDPTIVALLAITVFAKF